MKGDVKLTDRGWVWWLTDDENQPVAEGWEQTETEAHAALRHAASLQWPTGDN